MKNETCVERDDERDFHKVQGFDAAAR
jgi:hypothetical protein